MEYADDLENIKKDNTRDDRENRENITCVLNCLVVRYAAQLWS